MGLKICFKRHPPQSFLKEVERPLALAAGQDHCVVAVECASINSKDVNLVVERNFKDKKYQLLVCNSIGTTVDCEFWDIFLEKFLADLEFL